MYESEQEYQEELSRLSVELAKCRSEASQHEAVLDSLRLSSDEKISRLQEDRALLQVVIVCVWPLSMLPYLSSGVVRIDPLCRMS